MKKLSILFLSVMTLGLSISSCSKDDNQAAFEGKWELTSTGFIVNGKENLEPVTNQGGCNSEVFEYLANGTFTNTYSEFSNSKCTNYTEEGTWSRNGNTLTEKFNGDSTGDVYEITNLTSTELKLKETYTQSGTTVSLVRVFKRI